MGGENEVRTSAPHKGVAARSQGASNQRRRLLDGLVSAVSERGYPALTVEQIALAAGVSKRDFYIHFSSKEECFLAAFDRHLEDFAGGIAAAAAAESDPRARLIAGLEEIARMVEQEPEALALILVDSLALGPAAAAPRERSQVIFERLLNHALEPSRAGALPPLTARALVVGLRRVVYRAIRDSGGRELRGASPGLADWLLRYVPPAPAGASLGAVAAPASLELLVWDEAPPRRDLSAPERLLAASASVCCVGGYGALRIPDISSAAGTSNRTFYEHFSGKQEAVLAAFDALAEWALGITTQFYAAEGPWRQRVEAGTRALLACLSQSRYLASLAFLELPAIGRPGLERIDVLMERLGALFRGDIAGTAPPELVVQAIAGGVWGVLRHEAIAGSPERLPELASEIDQIILRGLGDAES